MRSYVITILLIICLVFWATAYPPATDEKKITEDFYENFYLYENSAKCLLFSQENLHITDSDEIFTLHSTDPELRLFVEECFDSNKANVIFKNGNTVYFICKSSRKQGKGIVYSSDKEKLDFEYIAKLIPLESDNWYYFESVYD